MSMHELNIGQQFKTLPMFMTPNEIKAQAVTMDRRTFHADGTRETHEAMWDRKLAEARSNDYSSSAGRTLEDRIKTEGIRVPPSIGHRDSSFGPPAYIQDGHHRIAVHAAVHGPDTLMPVEHHDDEAVRVSRRFASRKKAEIAARKPPLTPMTPSDEGRVNESMRGLGFR